MSSVTVQAPAKVNLYLEVLGKRDDGYHEIETVMLPVSLADELTVSLTGGRDERTALRVEGEPLDVPPERNFVWYAVKLFRSEFSFRGDVEVVLRKRIPAGGGLGGGSSDAAAALLALADLAGVDDLERLASVAALVGSDVPFFLYRRAAVCRGRGERVSPCSVGGFEGARFVIAVPPFSVSTAAVYAAWSEGARIPSPYGGADEFLRRWLEWGEAPFHNGLWEAAVRAEPRLAEYRSALPGGNWTLTGSGSAFFLPVRDEEEAREIEERIPAATRFRTHVVSAWSPA